MTTSAKEDHLRVLWGEINNYIQTAKYPLDFKRGGPLVINHQDIRKILTHGPNKGQKCAKSYITGLVASSDSIAAMQGHHVPSLDGRPMTLFVADECSSVPDEYYTMSCTWRHRSLFIGNCWDAANFWYKHVEAGDLPYDEASLDYSKFMPKAKDEQAEVH